jgi:hypothetical protein
MSLPSVDKAIDIADKLGIFQAVKNRLVKQPDPAADKLVTALEEISKIHTDVEKELVAYLSLYFDSADTADRQGRARIAEQRTVLVNLEGDKVRVRMAEAKGSCRKIWNIYERYLNPWFKKALSGDKDSQDKLEDLFVNMHDLDGDMMKAIDALAGWIGYKATETLNKVDDGEKYFDAANKIIRDARNEIMALRKKTSDGLSKIQDLKSEMIGISGAI